MGMAAVACLGFVFAACDDDNGGTDMGVDMAVTVHDMAMNNGDMTATPDLNPGPGTAQLIIADIEGTYPAPGGTSLPFSHLLFTSNSIPEQAGAPHQMDNRMPGVGNFLFGCTADYYDGTTTFPASQTNAGEITYKGYNTVLAANDGRAAGVYTPPIPDTIRCEFVQVGPLGTYVCGYGDVSVDAGANSVMGENPAAVLFPPLPQTNGACTIGTAVGTVCEQHPTVGGTTMITETLAGAGTYTTAVSDSIRVASAVNVLSVNGAAAPANPADPFAGVTLDGTTNLTVTWNCKTGSTIPGDGCSALSFTGLIALSNPKQDLPLGVAQCVVPSKTTNTATSGTLTLPKDYITKILGGSTTGPALVVFAQLNGDQKTSGGHLVVPTAGQGYFAFLAK